MAKAQTDKPKQNQKYAKVLDDKTEAYQDSKFVLRGTIHTDASEKKLGRDYVAARNAERKSSATRGDSQKAVQKRKPILK